VSLRDEYLTWHKQNKHNWENAAGETLLTQALDFADRFMEQRDKLERKVNDQARELRERDRYKKALEEIAPMCGNPNAVDACRLILNKCQEVLSD